VRMSRRSWVLGAAAACAVPSSGGAHHSYAMFDLTRVLTIRGVVAKVEWVNPHVFIWAYIPKPGGGHDLYAFETDPVSRLVAEGWTKDSLPPGEKVTIEYAPLKDGRPGGSLLRAKRANGTMLETRASRRRS
jgi:hypothetical protein